MVFDSSDISRFHFLEGCVGHFHYFLQFHFTATAWLRKRCASLSGNTLEGVEGFRKACAEGWIRSGAVGGRIIRAAMVSVVGKRVERDHLVTQIAGPAAYTDEVARPRPNTLALDRALFSSTQGEFPARTREPNVSGWTD